ncbi:AMP-dependent synthetase and ligase [Halosimplex carlsbadense 2-9-1]|uniref:AMP-dependent synthetase and ligase n=1 Tax=Halosimplex carlsbadense 2-9-1 TaxID=797114 RepID=M0CLX9_9EURY|nr:AMP-binding protein [Halosimplex carlsbadense]ELZ24256.1 AMP-dependent synthetase and ligase [Halosimplex carlsbadense 2-9-1]
MSEAEWVGAWSEKRAALSPDRIGLVDAATGREYTYAALDRRANRCARLLADHGVARAADDTGGPAGGRVAVVSRNRPEYVDLFFATGKTGGVLAPLSHRLAPPELAALLAAVDPELVVVEEPFAGLVGDATDEGAWDADAPILSLPVEGSGATTWEAYDAALPADDSVFEGPAVDPGDPHLFLHTGGSTGTPKETVVSHEALVWNSVNTITAWGLRDDDVTPMVFPMFHTGGWNVLTLPIFHMGGTVVIDREFDPGQILGIVEERSASVLVAVPAVLRMMTDHDRWADTDLSSLRFVKSGGGPCRESVMEAWWDRGVDLSQGYGLTECGPNNFAMPDDWPREKAHTVGVANVHVDARVVDDDGGELPAGEIGELQLRSPHAADGYWSSPQESAATFGEWVSTGDLARVDDEGYVSIEGRKKNMFVSGGENVYPAEVEDAIADHPAVADAVVIAVPDDQWGQVGKAVVELAADAGSETAADGAANTDPLALDDLRAFLDGRLARFKHPRHLAFVDELPTSGPDKLDRDAVAAEFGE